MRPAQVAMEKHCTGQRIAFCVLIVFLTLCLLSSFLNTDTSFHKPPVMKNTAVNKVVMKHQKDLIFHRTPVFESAVDINTTWNVLVWTEYFNFGRWLPDGANAFTGCKFANCRITHDKNHANKSDAVLMNLRNLNSVTDLPKHHPQHQKWIAYTRESPVHAFLNYTPFNSHFNATMTYKSDSDIVFPYGFVQPLEMAKGYVIPTTKTKLIAWFVSRCSTESKREHYVSLLQKFVAVDVYGSCGPLKCPLSQSGACLDMLESDYKFYISFENSLCAEYITEKVWKVLQRGVIPIVLGSTAHETLLPPSSYIDVRNFASPKTLAEYLLKLDRNDDLYNKYFEWKAHFTVKAQTSNVLGCQLCEYMNTHGKQTSIVKRLDLFWSPRLHCARPDQYFKSIV